MFDVRATPNPNLKLGPMGVKEMIVGAKVSRISGLVSVRLVSCLISWLASFALLPYLYLSRRLLDPPEIIVALVVFLVTGIITVVVVLVPRRRVGDHSGRVPDEDSSFNTHD